MLDRIDTIRLAEPISMVREAVPHGDADAQRWLLTGDLPCLDCGYNLRGLVGPVVCCPECAHLNDLRQAHRWSVKQLPVGVRQREHWPAASALCSLLVVGAVIEMWVLWRKGGPVVWPFIGLVAVAPMWGRTCWRWVQSCRRRGWATAVLAVVHLSSWGWVGGALGIWGSQPLPAFALMGLSLLGFTWAHFALKRAETTGQYRQDWRNWRVPVTAIKDQSAN